VTRAACLALGGVVLALLWMGPLPRLAPHYFSAHMAMHMGVVAVAAPLIALGLAGTRRDPTRRVPALFSPIPASVLELAVVWAWHAPALHHAARTTAGGLIAEQSTFLLAALLVWVSSFGGRPARDRAAAGVVALLLTSMHMTLLGALLALAPRPLYAHAAAMLGPSAALDDQHLGGAIMLVIGGAAYLAGGLWLASTLLVARAAPPQRELG
jgi:putative membrane protein